jgi:hypothetical protein
LEELSPQADEWGRIGHDVPPGLLKVRFATVRITPEGVNYLPKSWKLLFSTEKGNTWSV